MKYDVIQLYKCLCDKTRLRILNLLQRGPICVCDLQDVLGEPQVKMSKHLAYMKRAGMVESERKANWIFYRIPDNPHQLLIENLACLQDIQHDLPEFASDVARLNKRLGRGRFPSRCEPSAGKSK